MAEGDNHTSLQFKKERKAKAAFSSSSFLEFSLSVLVLCEPSPPFEKVIVTLTSIAFSASCYATFASSSLIV